MASASLSQSLSSRQNLQHDKESETTVNRWPLFKKTAESRHVLVRRLFIKRDLGRLWTARCRPPRTPGLCSRASPSHTLTGEGGRAAGTPARSPSRANGFSGRARVCTRVFQGSCVSRRAFCSQSDTLHVGRTAPDLGRTNPARRRVPARAPHPGRLESLCVADRRPRRCPAWRAARPALPSCPGVGEDLGTRSRTATRPPRGFR
uniref:Uncharacterized protein n=1 Tax=Rousettus aegyptiacus TaxID=9407 RepID=A0A7J8DXB5_ROUAE|nr:hypothetical protein HJG63_008332 [Rousettus aegyptiacus]